MLSFNTFQEPFKHIQENIKTPSYLNYRNAKQRMSVAMHYVINSTDKSVDKGYHENILTYQKLQGGEV